MKNILIAGLLLLTTFFANAQGIKQINSPEAKTLLQQNNKIVVLDVRTPGEFVQGHIANAVNIDVNQSDAIERINKLDKNATYLVYCRTKNRSGVVVNYMIQNGFKVVYQIVDGIAGLSQNNLLVKD
jgi:rhodanese-related sulfurtransferase